jgi:hypothetical protein
MVLVGTPDFVATAPMRICLDLPVCWKVYGTREEAFMEIELLYFEGCPNWRLADERLAEVASERGATVRRRLVTTPEEAEGVGFHGSPTILVDGRDPFAVGGEPTGLSCRIYETPDGPAGSPTAAQLRDALSD